MADSFLSSSELRALGFNRWGENVQISRHATFYFPERITLGNRVRIDDFCVVSAGGKIKFGDHIHVGAFCGLFGGAGIVFEDFSTLSSRVSIYSVSDDYSGNSLTNPTVPMRFKPGYQSGRVVVGRHAIVGAGATVLPGTTIGEGAAVGAHSLVKRTCSAWGIYAGIPARRIGARRKTALQLEKKLRAGL